MSSGRVAKLKCQFCSFLTFNQADIESHLKRNHVLYASEPIKPSTNWNTAFYYKCEFCIACVKEQNIFKHITYAHCDGKIFKCQFGCYYKGEKLESLYQHQKVKHNINKGSLICPMCLRFTAPGLKDMSSHMYNHFTKRALYFCKCCGFRSKSSVNSHISEKHIMCCFKDCGMALKDIYKLFSHYISHHFPKLILYGSDEDDVDEDDDEDEIDYCEYEEDDYEDEEDEEDYCEDEEDDYEDEEDYYEDEDVYDDEEVEDEEDDYDDEEDDYEDEDEEESIETTVKILCNLCSYQTSSMNSFKSHSKQKHPHVLYKCVKTCKYESTYFFSFYQHFFDKHLSKKNFSYNCFQCEFPFNHFRDLMQHMRDKHESTDYCFDCDIWADDDFIDHLINEHKVLNVSCKICNQRFNGRKYLKDHLNDDHSINISQFP